MIMPGNQLTAAQNATVRSIPLPVLANRATTQATINHYNPIEFGEVKPLHIPNSKLAREADSVLKEIVKMVTG